MNKKYIVGLSDEERRICQEVLRKLKGTSQKVRRAQILLKADAAGPDGWLWVAEGEPRLRCDRASTSNHSDGTGSIRRPPKVDSQAHAAEDELGRSAADAGMAARSFCGKSMSQSMKITATSSVFAVLSVFTAIGCSPHDARKPSLTRDNSSQTATPNANEKDESRMRLTTYLLFAGNCKEAMAFYQSIFGGELNLTTVGDSPMKDAFPAAMHARVVSARLKSQLVDISASDWLRPAENRIQGNTVCLYLSGGNREDTKSLFTKLSEGADVTDPLSDQPFGLYGALNDKFGNRWMFHSETE